MFNVITDTLQVFRLLLASLVLTFATTETKAALAKFELDFINIG
jgi:hypothetical protein